ncbi:MAG: hypothetical protein KBT03_03310, partial [Bacteroidales bacterium]|nr:hypothetical protein [Candidatus Scybalousia scybalohippi]
WAVFKGNCDIPYRKLIVDNKCEFESASIYKSGYVVCGVVGYQDDKRMPTIYTSPALVQKGTDEGCIAPIPSPSEWEQVIEYMAKIENFETYIPEGTSDENKLVNSEELERVEGEIPTKYSDLENDNHTVQDEHYIHTDNNFTTNEKNKLAGLENYDDSELRQDIQDIQDVIPSQATTDNKLADKEFVNSSIATSTATFQGTFDVVEDLGLTYEATHLQVETALESIVGSKTNNDYVFVFFTNPTTEVIEKYERYKFTSDDNSWNFEYVLNNSSFTSNQWASINSGITSLLVAQITTNKNDITTINQSLTALANRVGTAETNITNLQTAIGNVYTKQEADLKFLLKETFDNLGISIVDGKVCQTYIGE